MRSFPHLRWVLPVSALAVGGGLVLAGLLPVRREVPAAALVADTVTARAGAVAGEAAEDTVARVSRPAEEGRRILVSIDGRRLWLVDGQDTLLSAPVAVGMGQDFTYRGRTHRFETPRGRRTVLARASDPVWVVPEWHYYERAAKMSLDSVVMLKPGDRVLLGDSSWLAVQGEQVGRINHFGHFAPFTPGTEIIYDGRIYVPPLSTAQRRVPDALGPYKLDMGDGYLIHGTHPYNEESVGEAVSHGCVRMSNADLTRLYPLVPRGTPVLIF